MSLPALSEMARAGCNVRAESDVGVVYALRRTYPIVRLFACTLPDGELRCAASNHVPPTRREWGDQTMTPAIAPWADSSQEVHPPATNACVEWVGFGSGSIWPSTRGISHSNPWLAGSERGRGPFLGPPIEEVPRDAKSQLGSRCERPDLLNRRKVPRIKPV